MTPLPQLDPLALPAPAWLLSALLLLTFVLHLVPMNLVLGGAVIGLVARLRGASAPHAATLARKIAAWLPILVATAVTMGVAALLFLQVLYGRLFFTTAVLIAVPWLSVVGILIAAYYASYSAAGRAKKGGQANLAVWGLMVAGFATIAFIYANAMGLMLRPQEFVPRFQASASGLHLSFSDPTMIPRFLHVVLGALAVAGLGVAFLGWRARVEDESFSEWAIRHGVLWAAIATVINFLPGFWWLAALPREALLQFMGRDGWSTALFGLSIVSALGALGHLVGAAYGKNPGRLLAGGTGALALTVVLMVLMRDRARAAILGGVGYAMPTWVEPQWGPIAIFLALLVAAIGLVGWMVRALAKSKPAEKGQVGLGV